MQQGPRFLTENDINTIQLYTALTPGSSDGAWTPGYSPDLAQLGQLGQTGDGRFYRWALIGGTSTVAPAQLLMAAAQATNSTGLAIPSSQPNNTQTGSGNAANAALKQGSRSFNVTNGSTAVTADEFAGGFVEVLQTSGTNEGAVKYKLVGNTAASASGAITLYLAEPLDQPEELVAGTDTVNLWKNPWANVATSGTTGRAAGVLPVQVPNSSSAQYLAWLQVWGDCSVTADSTGTTAYEGIKQSATAGDVTAATAATDQVLGFALNTVTSGTASVYLKML